MADNEKSTGYIALQVTCELGCVFLTYPLIHSWQDGLMLFGAALLFSIRIGFLRD